MKTTRILSTLIAVLTSSVHAFPHTIIFDNKTNKAQDIIIKSEYKIRNLAAKSEFSSARERELRMNLPADDSFTFGSKDHRFLKLIINISGSLVTGLGKLGPIAKIEMHNDGKIKTSTVGKFEGTKVNVIAAKKATADRWADTKAWFSDTWQSIKARFNSMFATNKAEKIPRLQQVVKYPKRPEPIEMETTAQPAPESSLSDFDIEKDNQ